MYSSPISLHLKNYMCGSVLACPWNYNLAILSYEHWPAKKIWLGSLKKYSKTHCTGINL